MKIKEYKIVSDHNIEALGYIVKALCHQGWEPQGGVTTTPLKGTPIFFQAMVKPMPITIAKTGPR